MSKIVFLAPTIKTGGGNRVFIELANILCKKNDVSLLYPHNSGDYHTFTKNSNWQYVVIGKKASTKIAKLLNLCRCIYYVNKHLKDSVLIISDPIFCLLIPFICNKKRVYRFVQADDYRIYDDGTLLGRGYLLKLYKFLCLKMYKQQVTYIFNSQYVYDKFRTDSQRYDVPFAKVHPAINKLFFNSIDRVQESDGVSICLVARKHPCKGLVTFINAFHRLSPTIKAKLSFVTLISHDDLSNYNTMGMKILKPTSDSDIATVYKSSDIFISTSWWEGFGLPPLEAMACGCAVICSNSGGVNEFIKPDENCIVFEPKAEHELISAIEKMVNDESLRKFLSANGVKTAEKFSWEKSAKQLSDIISDSNIVV